MSAGALRSRLHHGHVGRMRDEKCKMSALNGLHESLLDNHGYDGRHSEGKTPADIFDEEERDRHSHCLILLFNLIMQWTKWIANNFLGSVSFIAQFLPLPSNIQSGSNWSLIEPALNPLQEARLRGLQQRLGVPFDGSRLEHQDALKQLWRLAYSDRELPSLKSELWKDMGWQGQDPSTDFRGGGFISLENLIFFAKNYPAILKSTKTQLEHELSLPNVSSVKDLPAYSLLKR